MSIRTLRIIQLTTLAVWAGMLVLTWFGPEDWVLIVLIVQLVALVVFFIALPWSVYKRTPTPKRDAED